MRPPSIGKRHLLILEPAVLVQSTLPQDCPHAFVFNKSRACKTSERAHQRVRARSARKDFSIRSSTQREGLFRIHAATHALLIHATA